MFFPKMAKFIIPVMIAAVAAGKSIPKMPNEIKEKFRQLQVLVNRNDEPKGKPFTALTQKPRPCDRVVIVGAGLAGLHMAYQLKKKGFDQIVVLEKESRVGGKILTVWHDGVPHEFGAAYTGINYQTSVYALAKELGVDDFVPRPSNITVWLDELPKPLQFPSYVIGTIIKLTKARNTIEAVGELIDAAYRYTVLHRQMFGKYEGELMHRPSLEVLSQLNQTYLAYLRSHRLLALYPVLLATQTIQGYGYLDEISAIYGLLWNPPDFLQGMIALGLGFGGKSNSDMFRKGFQQLTDKLAAFADIRLNVKIEGIKRDCDGVTIRFDDGQVKTEKFDFLIWAADAREALPLLTDPTPLEKEFSHLRNAWFTISLFDSKEPCVASSPIEYWMSNVLHKKEYSVMARRNSKLVINGKCPTTKGLAKSSVSFVSYQMSDISHFKSCQDTKAFNKHFKQRLGLDINVIKRKTWNYFPRFSEKKLAEGILWKIAENQGDQKTWYIGSSVIFESTKSVMEYNFQMLKRMEVNML